MTAEGFKYQLSVKVGDGMLNVRADAADEFRVNIDTLFGEGASTLALAPFFAQSALTAAPQPVAAPVVANPAVGVPLQGEAPTEKQVAFARKLGIDPTGMTKKALSAAIDAKVN